VKKAEDQKESTVTGAEWWAAFGSVATAIGSIATAAGVLFAAWQLAESRKVAKESKRVAEESKRIAQGEFLLRLDELFRHHDVVHRRLRPGGEWGQKGGGPSSNDNEAWADIESYMGLFERIKVLIDNGIVDLEIVNRLYGYRVSNITSCDEIRKGKLENPETRHGWSDFIALARALNRYPTDRTA
jgi:hypothetical protein